MTHVATRDDFAVAKQRTYSIVYVAGMGTSVRVQSLTEGERMKLLTKYGTEEGGANLMHRAAVVAMCVVDEQGDRLFSDGDVKSITEWRTHIIDAIYKGIDQLCELDMAKESERLEDSLKNCEATPCEGSRSDSPIGWVSPRSTTCSIN